MFIQGLIRLFIDFVQMLDSESGFIAQEGLLHNKQGGVSFPQPSPARQHRFRRGTNPKAMLKVWTSAKDNTVKICLDSYTEPK